MKFLVVVGLSIVFLVASRLPADVDWHPQDEAFVSSGEVLFTAKNATDLIEGTSEQNSVLGLVNASITSLHQNAALRNESFSNLTLRRRLECCGGDEGNYVMVWCFNSFVQQVYTQQRFYSNTAQLNALGVVCSDGTHKNMFGGQKKLWEYDYGYVFSESGFSGFYVQTDNAVRYVEFWTDRGTRQVTYIGKKIRDTRYGMTRCEVCHHLNCSGDKKVTGIYGRATRAPRLWTKIFGVMCN